MLYVALYCKYELQKEVQEHQNERKVEEELQISMTVEPCELVSCR